MEREKKREREKERERERKRERHGESRHVKESTFRIDKERLRET
jgi:hypothetical protein